MDFSLKAVFGIDSTGVRAELKQLRREVGSFASSMAKLGMGVAVGAFAALAKGAVDLGGKLSDTATQVGINVEALQVLNSIARDSGVTQEALAKILVKSRTAAAEAAAGSKEQAEAFRALNINVAEFMAAPQEKKLEMIGRAYASSTNKALAYNAITEIYGEKLGPKMMEVLTTLASKGFPAVAAAAKANGDVMSAETVAALDRAGDAIEAFKQRATIAVGNILVNFRTEEGMKVLLYRLLEVGATFGGRVVDAIAQAADIGRAVFTGVFASVASQFGDDIVAKVAGALVALKAQFPALKILVPIDETSLLKMQTAGKSVAELITNAIAQTQPTSFSKQWSSYWKVLGDEAEKAARALDAVDLKKDADTLRNAGKDLEASGKAAADSLAAAGKSAAQEISAAAQTLAGAVAGIRGGSTFNSADDATLAEIVRRNRAAAARLRNPALTGNAGDIAPNLEAGRLEAEALNAQRELDLRNRTRTDISRFGVDRARQLSGLDPVAFESLLRQIGDRSTDQRTANATEELVKIFKNGQARTAAVILNPSG